MQRTRSSNSVIIQSKATVQACDDLQGLQLIDASPYSVPQATFVRLPNESSFEHTLYMGLNIPSTQNITDVCLLEEHQTRIDSFVYRLYAHRSIMVPLQKYIKVKSSDVDLIIKIAEQHAKPLNELLSLTIMTVDACIKHIQTLLSNEKMWKNGHYSDELLFSLCKTLHSLCVLDSIHFAKQSIKLDVSGLNQMSIMCGNSKGFFNSAIQQWVNEENAVEKKLLTELGKLKSEDLINVTSIIYRYIKNALNSNNFVLDQMKYYHLVSLYLFVKLCPPGIQISEIPYLKNLFESAPFIPLFHEHSFSIVEKLQKLDFFKASNVVFNDDSVNPIKAFIAIRKKFTAVTSKIHRLLSNTKNENVYSNIALDGNNSNTHNINEIDMKSYQDLYFSICEALQLISSTSNILREQYAYKLAKPPAEPKDMKPYERSVRQPNYTQSELKIMLQLLALCRELHDMLRSSIPAIYPKISLYIQQTFQNFVKNTLEKIVIKSKRKQKKIKEEVDLIRDLAGDWIPGELIQIVAKKVSEFKEREILKRNSAPSSQIIEFVRIQIQQMITPESVFIKPSKKILQRGHAFVEKDENRLKEFIRISANWVSVLQFEQTLTEASDQSCFYFKEVQLDLNNVVQFPVRSSLPFILCQYALDNYYQPELTEIIFYPLSIYDDAASVALNTHKSKLMFDEITAEARVCLDTLSVLIGEFTFNAFRTFATLRQMPEKMINILKIAHARHWPHSQAYRLRTLLQQNQYYLLSRQITLKSLIAPRVDDEINSAVSILYKISDELGVVSSLALQRVLSIIKETHRLLSEQGLPLMPFKDIERTAKWDNVLLSFASKYLRDIIAHLTRTLLRQFSLLINPLRLIPPKKQQLPSDLLGPLNLGKILKDSLDSSTAFVTVHHFSAILRQLNDGSIVVLAQNLQQYVRKSYDHFVTKYKLLHQRLFRIKDAQFGTSAHSAFARYEGAYKYFLNDNQITSMLHAMQNIGNTIAVAEMLDEALLMKEFNTTQVLSYMRSVDEDGKPRDEIEWLFDNNFQDAFQIIKKRPLNSANNSQQMILTMVIDEFISAVKCDSSLYDEPNRDSFDFTTMSGFSTIWSVLEFVYCLLETLRGSDLNSGFLKYGQGVQLTAALMLLITDQVDLSNLLSIGRKLQRHNLTDMSGMADEKTLRFISISRYESATIEWAIDFLNPYVHNHFEKK